MKIFEKIVILSFIFLLTSCGTLKKGFSNQKKNSSDEFLVEKKSPLIMPPDYNELPVPNIDNNLTERKENSIKNLVATEENTKKNSNVKSSESISLEESILDKIKDN